MSWAAVADGVESSDRGEALRCFHPAVATWFQEAFAAPTAAQCAAWPAIAAGEHTLLLAPTGSGKTLAAFLVAIDRIMFPRQPMVRRGVRALYISPLKALAVDVERNLRAPLAGVAAVAERDGLAVQRPRIGIRSGDTSAQDRRRMTREPPEILITTPESLFLLLTSRAREVLQSVEVVILDEIHALAGSKRGAHLLLSLERLESLREAEERGAGKGLQRIGLSATQRPLEAMAQWLGGWQPSATGDSEMEPRRVSIVQADMAKQFELTVELPVEDLAELAGSPSSGPAAAGPRLPSIWPSIHPRLVELIRSHRSTIIFANSRRLAERLAAAINDVAGEELCAAHHGSVAKDTRQQIEERLKQGRLPAMVATSSLELGIDMGAVDLVIQIAAPPSVAAGIQRIGRAGHQVGAASRGIIFPKFRADLLACAAVVERMRSGAVELTRYPRHPLDVLAQQIVAMAALDPIGVDRVFDTVRRAAPFATLSRSLFDDVLELLSGRYPSAEFAELRPRLHWDRVTGTIHPRRGSQRLAVANAGTIPDRGLYGVFLPSAEGGPASRVGELDEEMVFESRVGDVFLLGASSWRVLEITHDRVIVDPAPGESGRMPFWRGDGPGRPFEFGQAIGRLTRQLLDMPISRARNRLIREHGLQPHAADNLLRYLQDQQEATTVVPSDAAIVVESFLDEVGDWRVVVMSPHGSRVHAPWALAVFARLQQEALGEIDMMWSDDGMVFRLPESERPPEGGSFFPAADEIEDMVVQALGGSALFAARFRENAARALLLPRRQPGRRTPLWLQRRRAADLLAVAARYERFPIMLETFRECLRDLFDLPALRELLQAVAQRRIRVQSVESARPSPFAASLLFGYTANFLYQGDAPLAERRAAALALDHRQLRELLGDAELRELLEPEVVAQLARELQKWDLRYFPDADALHDLLRGLGDLSPDELEARWRSCRGSGKCVDLAEALHQLQLERRIAAVRIAGEQRWLAVEDVARYRDALGVVPPAGIPAVFLEAATDPLADIVARYARTHVPFTAEQVAQRLGLGVGPVREVLQRLGQRDRVVEGAFLSDGTGREWCDVQVLRRLKQRSLALLRRQVAPVEPQRWVEFLADWQGVTTPHRGLDGLLDVLEQLQGLPLPLSVWEQAVLPARVSGYQAADLDLLCTAGEVVWRGFAAIGDHDGRIAFYLADAARLLSPEPGPLAEPAAVQLAELLAARGASFFSALAAETSSFPPDLLRLLWQLVWSGQVTNDSLAPLRGWLANRQKHHRGARRRGGGAAAYRSRRTARLPGSEGRWSRWPVTGDAGATGTARKVAIAHQLLRRYGVLTREAVRDDGVPGGFAGLYPVLKAMEEAGQVRRGYFVAGQGAAQFALPGADDRLRRRGQPGAPSEAPELTRRVLAACDPANPYGTALPWPPAPSATRPQRTAGAYVVLVAGELLGYVHRGGGKLTSFVPGDEPDRSAGLQQLASALGEWADRGRIVYVQQVDGTPVASSPLASALLAHGFQAYAGGYQRRPIT